MEGNNFETNSGELNANDLEKVKKEEAEIVSKVKEMRGFLYSLKGRRGEVHGKIADIGDELEKNHPNLRETYLFHIMIYRDGYKTRFGVK